MEENEEDFLCSVFQNQEGTFLRDYAPNQTIVSSGKTNQHLFVLISGLVRVDWLLLSGAKFSEEISDQSDWPVFGEISLLKEQGKRETDCSVVSLTNCSVRLIPVLILAKVFLSPSSHELVGKFFGNGCCQSFANGMVKGGMNVGGLLSGLASSASGGSGERPSGEDFFQMECLSIHGEIVIQTFLVNFKKLFSKWSGFLAMSASFLAIVRPKDDENVCEDAGAYRDVDIVSWEEIEAVCLEGKKGIKMQTKTKKFHFSAPTSKNAKTLVQALEVTFSSSSWKQVMKKQWDHCCHDLEMEDFDRLVKFGSVVRFGAGEVVCQPKKIENISILIKGSCLIENEEFSAPYFIGTCEFFSKTATTTTITSSKEGATILSLPLSSLSLSPNTTNSPLPEIEVLFQIFRQNLFQIKKTLDKKRLTENPNVTKSPFLLQQCKNPDLSRNTSTSSASTSSSMNFGMKKMKRSLTSENLLEGESGEERLSIQKMDEIVNYVVGLYPFRQKEIRNFLATFDQFLIEKEGLFEGLINKVEPKERSSGEETSPVSSRVLQSVCFVIEEWMKMNGKFYRQNYPTFFESVLRKLSNAENAKLKNLKHSLGLEEEKKEELSSDPSSSSSESGIPSHYSTFTLDEKEEFFTTNLTLQLESEDDSDEGLLSLESSQGSMYILGVAAQESPRTFSSLSSVSSMAELASPPPELREYKIRLKSERQKRESDRAALERERILNRRERERSANFLFELERERREREREKREREMEREEMDMERRERERLERENQILRKEVERLMRIIENSSLSPSISCSALSPRISLPPSSSSSLKSSSARLRSSSSTCSESPNSPSSSLPSPSSSTLSSPPPLFAPHFKKRIVSSSLKAQKQNHSTPAIAIATSSEEPVLFLNSTSSSPPSFSLTRKSTQSQPTTTASFSSSSSSSNKSIQSSLLTSSTLRTTNSPTSLSLSSVVPNHFNSTTRLLSFPSSPPTSGRTDADLLSLRSNMSGIERDLERELQPRLFTHSVVVIAETITVMMSRLFRSIVPSEFHDGAWQGEQRAIKAPNLDKLGILFNRLAYLCTVEILYADSDKSQIQALMKCIELASVLKLMQNFEGTAAVVSIFDSASILRLKLLWKSLSKKATNVKDEHTRLFDPLDNSQAYFETEKKCEGPIVPFLAPKLREFRYLYERNSKGDANSIDLSFMQKVGGKINEYLEYQTRFFSLPEPDLAIVALLNGNLDVPAHDIEDLFYERSQIIQPIPSRSSSGHSDTSSSILSRMRSSSKFRNHSSSSSQPSPISQKEMRNQSLRERNAREGEIGETAQRRERRLERREKRNKTPPSKSLSSPPREIRVTLSSSGSRTPPSHSKNSISPNITFSPHDVTDCFPYKARSRIQKGVDLVGGMIELGTGNEVVEFGNVLVALYPSRKKNLKFLVNALSVSGLDEKKLFDYLMAPFGRERKLELFFDKIGAHRSIIKQWIFSCAAFYRFVSPDLLNEFFENLKKSEDQKLRSIKRIVTTFLEASLPIYPSDAPLICLDNLEGTKIEERNLPSLFVNRTENELSSAITYLMFRIYKCLAPSELIQMEPNEKPTKAPHLHLLYCFSERLKNLALAEILFQKERREREESLGNYARLCSCLFQLQNLEALGALSFVFQMVCAIPSLNEVFQKMSEKEIILEGMKTNLTKSVDPVIPYLAEMTRITKDLSEFIDLSQLIKIGSEMAQFLKFQKESYELSYPSSTLANILDHRRPLLQSHQVFENRIQEIIKEESK